MQFANTLEQKMLMKLTPKMYFSLQVLQMSQMEFADFLNEKCVENVLLEIEPPDVGINFQQSKPGKSDYKQKSTENYLENLPLVNQSEQQIIERWIYEQLPNTVKFTEQQRLLFKYLVRNLNSDGYLDVDIYDAALKYDLGYQEGLFVLNVLQQLEPRGIGARSLKECLLLQIEHLKDESDISYQILSEQYHLLIKQDFKGIAKQLNCTIPEVNEALAFLTTLSVRPLSVHIPTDTHYIIPDLIISKNGGQYEIELTKSHLPKVTISTAYNYFDEQLDHTTKRFLQTHRQQAEMLLGAIQKREETLLNIGMAIIHLQPDFIEFGLCALKPMGLKKMAEQLNVHQSTISRAVKHKYVQTPNGLFELNQLFISGMENDNGEVYSSYMIKEYIKALIADEDKRKPLSDQKIGNLLKEKGVVISRRTVAKYREALGILSSMKRVQY